MVGGWWLVVVGCWLVGWWLVVVGSVGGSLVVVVVAAVAVAVAVAVPVPVAVAAAAAVAVAVMRRVGLGKGWLRCSFCSVFLSSA